MHFKRFCKLRVAHLLRSGTWGLSELLRNFSPPSAQQLCRGWTLKGSELGGLGWPWQQTNGPRAQLTGCSEKAALRSPPSAAGDTHTCHSPAPAAHTPAHAGHTAALADHSHLEQRKTLEE